jgi:hypothetical protein
MNNTTVVNHHMLFRQYMFLPPIKPIPMGRIVSRLVDFDECPSITPM